MLLKNTSYIKRISFLLLVSVISLLVLSRPTHVSAVTLVAPTDYLSSKTVNITNVTHSVSFVIPLTGHTIIATDYIRVTLPDYSSVTAPSSGTGWSGTPTFGVTGNTAWITGVTANPGDGIGIGGITATNPALPSDFDVTIDVSDDVSGTTIYDTVTFEATILQNQMSTSVTVGTNNASIEFFGFSSPGSFVTIMLNGGVAGTISSDSNGDFTHQITGLEENTNYSVSIFAQDTFLRQTQAVSFIVGTLPNTNHIISNIVIPTTIDIDKTDINAGEILNVFGLAHPLSQVTVWVGNGGLYSDVIAANSVGTWTYPFDSGTNPLGDATHITYAREVVSGGFTSIYTQSVSFTSSSCIASDVNCDGYVNLTDFSIMLFYWLEVNPANDRADINGDTKVDLTDFSIMLFNWTG